jgi:hypothetical protein
VIADIDVARLQHVDRPGIGAALEPSMHIIEILTLAKKSTRTNDESHTLEKYSVALEKIFIERKFL